MSNNERPRLRTANVGLSGRSPQRGRGGFPGAGRGERSRLNMSKADMPVPPRPDFVTNTRQSESEAHRVGADNGGGVGGGGAGSGGSEKRLSLSLSSGGTPKNIPNPTAAGRGRGASSAWNDPSVTYPASGGTTPTLGIRRGVTSPPKGNGSRATTNPTGSRSPLSLKQANKGGPPAARDDAAAPYPASDRAGENRSGVVSPTPGIRSGVTSPPRGNRSGGTMGPSPGIRSGATSPSPGIRSGATSPSPGIRSGATSPSPGIRSGATSPSPGIRSGATAQTPGIRNGARPTSSTSPNGTNSTTSPSSVRPGLSLGGGGGSGGPSPLRKSGSGGLRADVRAKLEAGRGRGMRLRSDAVGRGRGRGATGVANGSPAKTTASSRPQSQQQQPVGLRRPTSLAQLKEKRESTTTFSQAPNSQSSSNSYKAAVSSTSIRNRKPTNVLSPAHKPETTGVTNKVEPVKPLKPSTFTGSTTGGGWIRKDEATRFATAEDESFRVPTWHYTDNTDTPQGPVTGSFLKYLWSTESIPVNTLVWKAGMGEWIELRYNNELKHWKRPKRDNNGQIIPPKQATVRQAPLKLSDFKKQNPQVVEQIRKQEEAEVKARAAAEEQRRRREEEEIMRQRKELQRQRERERKLSGSTTSTNSMSMSNSSIRPAMSLKSFRRPSTGDTPSPTSAPPDRSPPNVASSPPNGGGMSRQPTSLQLMKEQNRAQQEGLEKKRMQYEKTDAERKKREREQEEERRERMRLKQLEEQTRMESEMRSRNAHRDVKRRRPPSPTKEPSSPHKTNDLITPHERVPAQRESRAESVSPEGSRPTTQRRIPRHIRKAWVVKRLFVEMLIRKVHLKTIQKRFHDQMVARDATLSELSEELSKQPNHVKRAIVEATHDNERGAKLDKMERAAQSIQRHWGRSRQSFVERRKEKRRRAPAVSIKKKLATEDEIDVRYLIHVDNPLQRNLTQVSFDKTLLHHAHVMASCGLIGLFLSCIAVAVEDGSSPLMNVQTVDLLREGESTPAVNACKSVSSLLTVVLLFYMYHYYVIQMRIFRKISAIQSIGLLGSPYRNKFIGEMIVCAIHIPPQLSWININRMIVAFMFLRVYLLLRVLRDHSQIYKQRKDLIAGDSGITQISIMNWWMSFKTLFLLKQGRAVIALSFLSLFTFSFITYLFEANWFHFCEEAYCEPGVAERRSLATLGNSIYTTIITSVAVGYGDSSPTTLEGRATSMVNASLGVVVVSILTSVVLQKLQLTEQQHYVVSWMSGYLQEREWSVAGVRLIQRFWRFRKNLHAKPMPHESQNAHLSWMRRHIRLLYRLMRSYAQFAYLNKLHISRMQGDAAENIAEAILDAKKTILENQAKLQSMGRQVELKVTMKRRAQLMDLGERLKSFSENQSFLKNSLRQVARRLELEGEVDFYLNERQG